MNHVGEAVAMVVADTPSQAQDAVEAVVVEYQPMEAVVDLKDAATDRVKVRGGSHITVTPSGGAR